MKIEGPVSFLLKEVYVEKSSTDGDKRLQFEGIFSESDNKNKNNRVYKKGIWERNLKEGSAFRGRLDNRAVLGELEHPDIGTTSLKRVSHQFLDAKLQEDGRVWAKGQVLNTPEGRILAELFAVKYPVGASSRGNGTSEKNDDGIEEVNEDYELDTWDFVYDPSVECVETHIVDESRIRDLVKSEDDVVSIFEHYGCKEGDVSCVVEKVNNNKKEDFCLECVIEEIEKADIDKAEKIFTDALSKVDSGKSEVIDVLFKLYRKKLTEIKNSEQEIEMDENKTNNESIKVTEVVSRLVERANKLKERALAAEEKLAKEDKEDKEDKENTESEGNKVPESTELKERFEAAKLVIEDLISEKEKLEGQLAELTERYDVAKKIAAEALSRLKEDNKEEQEDDKDKDDKDKDDKKKDGPPMKDKKDKEDEEDEEKDKKESDKKDDADDTSVTESKKRKFSAGNAPKKRKSAFMEQVDAFENRAGE